MRVALITMQKNEDRLLDCWIKYHGDIFGRDNLFIFDNGSTSEEVKETLRTAACSGTNVSYAYPQPIDFERKGEIVAGCMQELRHRYDFFVPLDVDEFLDLETDMPFTADASSLMSEFERLKTKARRYFRIEKCYNNIPHSCYVKKGVTKKLIVGSGEQFKLDNGFHLYDWLSGMDTVPGGVVEKCNFVHVHFHSRDFEGLLESAREKLKLRVPNFRGFTLANYTGHGLHVAPYFGMSPQEYSQRDSLDGAVDISQAWKMKGLGDVPFSGSSAHRVLSLEEMLDPVNLFYIAGKNSRSVDELGFVRKCLGSSSNLLQYGSDSTALLACEMGLPSVTVVEPHIDAVKIAVTDRDYAAYLHLGRLRYKSDFSVDLRMRSSVKQHVPRAELDAYARPLGDDQYDAVILAGELGPFLAASLYLLEQSSFQDRILVFACHQSESVKLEIEPISRLFTIEDSVGCFARLTPRADKQEIAKSLIVSTYEKYLSKSEYR
ncbi:glycosyltransferase family 2 protein [Methylobacterium oxalidis]|uniref:Uncharacterized protein n=1 Tax=Methylobacterium oxalidis TaxID=944322 RepID=A0A512JBQ9_9HYPH|nr:glycosyltransferase family 2 protein [Methylobacterium oxalidis]GEP07376.1 hypothetical protein MOX02_54140 [Methylobacterium oxalidis]GJE33027.1 hypothetical protein LDDCCGHA_3226 [Methylobacterium oxalidis]GLS64486.1 hypothetical protein GCM10007888_28670 [Methylobacterium oxalidis]